MGPSLSSFAGEGQSGVADSVPLSRFAGEGGEHSEPGEGRDGTIRWVLLLILGTLAVRVAAAWAMGLGVDESYMVAAGRTLRLGYFDHPPAAWWLSWGAAHLLGTEAPVAVRLPFLLLFALSTWLMYRLGTATAGRRAGLWAAVLLNLSPVFTLTTASWVLPDGPLDCALLGAALCLMHALVLPRHPRAAAAWWGGAGACAGLALFSKYSAVLTIGGAVLYLLTQPAHRRWLRRPHPYGAAAIAAAVFAPVIAWNATHGWASFAFQGARAAAAHLHPLAPLATLGGEALFVLPWIWLPMIALLAAALRRGPVFWRHWLLAWLALPPIAIFALVALWSSQRVLYHWAAPGYLMLFPLLGEWVARHLDNRHVRRTMIGTAGLLVAAVAVVAVQVRTDWLRPAVLAFAHGRDPDLDGIDWTSLRTGLAARGWLDRPGLVVGATNWRDAGKIAHALGPGVTVICLNADARQFGFGTTPADAIGKDVLILAPEHADRVRAEYGGVFGSIEALPPLAIRLAGRDIATVSVFLGHGLKAWPPGG
jgi:4-amino-4-deoxy-L-arabinose transferase-like glycosyltransferase